MQNSVLRTFLIAGIVFLALLAVVNILFALLLGFNLLADALQDATDVREVMP